MNSIIRKQILRFRFITIIVTIGIFLHIFLFVNIQQAYAICPSNALRVISILTDVSTRGGGSSESLNLVIERIRSLITSCEGDPIDPSITPPPEGPFPTLVEPGGNASARALSYAAQLSPLLEKYKCIERHGNTEVFCRNRSNFGTTKIKSRYRLGFTDGFGNDKNGRYWCATFTGDVMNMVVGKNLSLSESVLFQAQNWRELNYPFYHYYKGGQEKEILNTIKPGCLMFYMASLTQHISGHVAIVNYINLDAKGNGRLITYDANGPYRESHYTLNKWLFDRDASPWMEKHVAFGCLPDDI